MKKKLVITIHNRSHKRLQTLLDWIADALDNWDTGESPMQGTHWDSEFLVDEEGET